MCKSSATSPLRAVFTYRSSGIFKLAKIIIDSVEYDSDELSAEALAQVQSIQFVDSEVTRLTGKIAAMNTARIAYSSALQELLANEQDSQSAPDS